MLQISSSCISNLSYIIIRIWLKECESFSHILIIIYIYILKSNILFQWQKEVECNGLTEVIFPTEFKNIVFLTVTNFWYTGSTDSGYGYVSSPTLTSIKVVSDISWKLMYFAMGV